MTNRQLKQQLRSLQAIAPSKGWLTARRDVLLVQVRAQCAFPDAVGASAPLDWRGRLPERLQRLQLVASSALSVVAARRAVVAALVSVFVLASAGYVVAASGDAYPGSRLYGLKLVVESVRLRLAASPQARVALQTEFAGRRLQELRVIMRRQESNLPAAETLVSQFESSVDKVSETASQATSGPAERSLEIATIVDEKVAEYQHALKETNTTLTSPELSRRVSHALARVNRAGTEALKVIVSKDGAPAVAVASKIGEKIKNAEETLELADTQLAGVQANGGAKGGAEPRSAQAAGGSASPASNEVASQVSEARDKSAVAKTNLAEAKKKVVEGDYKAAVAILEGVADIVNEVSETAKTIASENKSANHEGQVKGETVDIKGGSPSKQDTTVSPPELLKTSN